MANSVPFFAPQVDFDKKLLIGSWETEYMEWGREELIIRSDGKYKQVFIDNYLDEGKNIFETDWNEWWIESLPDGGSYLHLEMAKFYLEGFDFIDLPNGFYLPCAPESEYCINGEIKVPYSMYDWIREELVDMSDELILNIRINEEGEIVLFHLWISSDGGFAIFGGESEIFRKIPDL